MRLRMLITAAVAAALAVASGGVALGQDASLIGPTRAALDIVLPYYPPSARAAAMGRSTVALEGVDSHNPAALAFVKGYDVLLNYGRADFHHGPDLDIYNAQAVFPFPLIGGVGKLMGFAIDTRHEERSRMGGNDTKVSAYEFGLAYGAKIPIPEQLGQLGVGFAGYPYDPARLTLTDPDGGGTVARARAISQLGSIRLGALYKPIEQVSFGLEYTHIKDSAWAKYTGIERRFSSNYHVNLWTVGLAFRPDQWTVITVQDIFGRATGQGVDMSYSVFSAGIERQIPITETFGFALRAGVLEGDPTWGVGVNLPQGWRADYAFLPAYGEGVDKAFGHATFHMFSVGKSF